MNKVIETPWDERALGYKTYEVATCDTETLNALKGLDGHFSIKVPPLVSKELLHKHGFYYCDTLLEPVCDRGGFTPVYEQFVSVKQVEQVDTLTPMCRNTFTYDRFHRDFNIDPEQADQRYVNWLYDIADSGGVLALYYKQELTGFFAYHDERILLHALKPSFRGRGMAKYFWSEACRYLFSLGYSSLSSSVSAANLPVVNLYHSLGFTFKEVVDVYHKVQP